MSGSHGTEKCAEHTKDSGSSSLFFLQSSQPTTFSGFQLFGVGLSNGQSELAQAQAQVQAPLKTQKSPGLSP
jgi:hypothetical protein